MTDPDSIEDLPDSESLGFAAPAQDRVANDEETEFVQSEDVDKFFGEVVHLSDEEREDFENLITFGRKSVVKTVFGHTVLVSTLTVDEELAVGLLVKPYQNSDAYQRAYKTAVVAASVREVDGAPLYVPLSEKEDAHHIMRKRWERTKSYYPVVVDQMYRAVTELEAELFELVDKIAKKTSG